MLFLVVMVLRTYRSKPGTRNEAQVDSFPGPKLYHIYEILKTLQPHHQVRELILSVALNNCLERLLPKTTEKQLSLLTSIARQVFPNATIRFPIINFSDRLEKDQQQRLKTFNKVIISKYNFLTEINPLLFQVNDKDLIHWTTPTANKIF